MVENLAGLDAEWRQEAACRNHPNPNLWFPVRGADVGAAKQVCDGCPVRTECGEYAVAAGEKYGVWGGLSENQRRVIRARRRVAA